MEEYLAKLHNTLIEILDFVCKICEENNLTYFLVYGTALGAYRHGDFIPWDDDLDIAMPRNDYLKFLEIMHNDANNLFCIQDETNEPNYYLIFTKVRKKGTKFIEKYAKGMYEENGIYIDVFPLDFIDKKSKLQYIKHHVINYVKHVLKFKSCKCLYKEKKNFISYMLDYLICLPLMFFKNNRLLKVLNNLMVSNLDLDHSDYLVSYDDEKNSAIMHKTIYYPPRKLYFNEKLYNVPNKIEEYLSIEYGNNYMELPSEEERHTHQPIEIKF